MSQLVALGLSWRETSVQVQNLCAGAESARFCTATTLHRAEAHTQMIVGTGCAQQAFFLVLHLQTSKGRGGLALLLVGRLCVGVLKRAGQALAYKRERETML